MAERKHMAEKKNVMVRLSEILAKAIRFITYDIWRITENEMSSRLNRTYIYVAKTIILAVRGFQRENLQTRASALTYSTLLALVPLLAVLLGIASGFGVRDAVRGSLESLLPSQSVQLDAVFGFVDNYLSLAKGGLFLGIGFVLLFYTVLSLISNIENSFNDIWQVQKARPMYRKVTDYLALFIILPVLMTVSSGLSLFISTLRNSFLKEYVFLTPVADSLLPVIPFVITVLFFTLMYVLLPNTKVRFGNALVAGFLVGCAFQVFQYFYISGQIWVSKYNAIYGSFAALPLLLLWLQLSWLMCLFGAELAYASQNVRKFSFERDTQNISRRYKDFVTLLVASQIVKRFEMGETPYTADELSDEKSIPIRLTTDILYLLSEIGLINETHDRKDERIVRYQPAFDIGKMSVGMLLQEIDRHGSENFKIDTEQKYSNEWKALMKTRKDMFVPNNEILLREL